MKRFCSINQGEEPAIAPVRVQGAELRNKRSHHSCDLCDKVIIGDLEWTGEAVGTASHKDTRHSFPLLISLSECISRNLLALFVCQGFWSQSTQSGRFRCPALSIISNINTHFLNGGRVSFLDSGTANMLIIRAFQGLKKRHSALESGNQLGTSFNFFWLITNFQSQSSTLTQMRKCLLQHPILLPLPAAHLKSKKHHYHVRKRMKSDPACDQPQVPAAPPASAAETAESLSEDSCATVASGCGETSLESSQDTRTTHKEAVTLWESRWLRTAHTRAHSGFQHGSALTAGCFLPVLVGLLFFYIS